MAAIAHGAIMSRPFSVGDLVVLTNGFTGYISAIKNDTCILVVIGTNNYQVTDDDILTIRTPRKGSAESRGIVAACLWEIRGIKRTKVFIKKCDITPMHETIESAICALHRIYRVQKSMLK